MDIVIFRSFRSSWWGYFSGAYLYGHHHAGSTSKWLHGKGTRWQYLHQDHQGQRWSPGIGEILSRLGKIGRNWCVWPIGKMENWETWENWWLIYIHIQWISTIWIWLKLSIYIQSYHLHLQVFFPSLNVGFSCCQSAIYPMSGWQNWTMNHPYPILNGCFREPTEPWLSCAEQHRWAQLWSDQSQSNRRCPTLRWMAGWPIKIGIIWEHNPWSGGF